MQDLELEALGRAAAEQVAGNSAVEQVEVESGQDSEERPIYRFSFLIDRNRSPHRLGLIYTRLIQRLSDELAARGDPHLPLIQILNAEDWNNRAHGGPV